MDNRIKVRAAGNRIIFCKKEESGLYSIYKTATSGKKAGTINLDYLIKINDRCYKVLV